MRQIYWVVVAKRSWGRSPKIWHSRFYNSRGEAQLHAMNRNDMEKKLKHPRSWYVKRVQLEFKDAINYDVYEHEFKRINK